MLINLYLFLKFCFEKIAVRYYNHVTDLVHLVVQHDIISLLLQFQ